jgi:hypothetical protein
MLTGYTPGATYTPGIRTDLYRPTHYSGSRWNPFGGRSSSTPPSTPSTPSTSSTSSTPQDDLAFKRQFAKATEDAHKRLIEAQKKIQKTATELEQARLFAGGSGGSSGTSSDNPNPGGTSYAGFARPSTTPGAAGFVGFYGEVGKQATTKALMRAKLGPPTRVDPKTHKPIEPGGTGAGGTGGVEARQIFDKYGNPFYASLKDKELGIPCWLTKGVAEQLGIPFDKPLNPQQAQRLADFFSTQASETEKDDDEMNAGFEGKAPVDISGVPCADCELLWEGF